MTDIFVFGSNLAGIHGAGSALEAVRFHGARRGIGQGRWGLSYAIPTKGYRLEILPLNDIRHHVNEFLQYARNNPDLTFNVVAIGCGLAGYTPAEIAPMFRGASRNVMLPAEFWQVLEDM